MCSRVCVAVWVCDQSICACGLPLSPANVCLMYMCRVRNLKRGVWSVPCVSICLHVSAVGLPREVELVCVCCVSFCVCCG